jgi:phosphatidylglycerol---prolipoprotein diacylglyceryl transferase
MEGLLVFAVAQWVFRRQQRSGLTTAAVCLTYGVARFIDEFWREPDIGQPLFFGWMSKGQLLTLPMIALAIMPVIWNWRTNHQSRHQ